jgi:hypothetical protein
LWNLLEMTDPYYFKKYFLKLMEYFIFYVLSFIQKIKKEKVDMGGNAFQTPRIPREKYFRLQHSIFSRIKEDGRIERVKDMFLFVLSHP